jgi:hypothetical protein
MLRLQLGYGITDPKPEFRHPRHGVIGGRLFNNYGLSLDRLFPVDIESAYLPHH